MLWKRLKIHLLIHLVVAGLLCVTYPAISHATTIEVLPQQDAYLVSGGVIHHTNYTKDRTEAASCSDCFWKIKEICKSWSDANHGSCPWLRLQCPVDMQLVEVFRANAISRPAFSSRDWYLVGYSCIGQSGPISTVEIATAITDSWLARVPNIRLKYLPPSDAILWHPLKYELLSPDSLTFTKTILGVRVTLNANSSVEFRCQSLASISNCISNNSNQIKFKKVGIYHLTAISKWRATYNALGVEGIEVSGPNPSSSTTTLFNVHPLFTHLAQTKGAK
jgi:hypothetical protein